MTVSDFQSYLIKYKKHLALFVALSILACYFYINMKQSYTAEIYIQYLGDKAAEGLAPDGTEINPYEINNSLIVKKALQQLGIDVHNHEEIRKSVKITPIVPTSEDEKHASYIENFTNYKDDEDGRFIPVHYSVKFTTDKGKDFAIDFLGALISQYRIYYVENHAYESDVALISDKAVLEYDYFVTTDTLSDRISSNVKYIENIIAGDTDYRSPSTGYSMNDLIDEYTFILENDLAPLIQEIFDKGITKNSSVLKMNLQSQADNAQLDSDQNMENSRSEKDLMLIYSDKNNEYTWDTVYNNPNNEGNQVREDTERDYKYSRDEMTYDNLMLAYIDYTAKGQDLLIDKEYYLRSMNYFGDEDTVNPEIDTKLSAICGKYNNLHEITEKTLDDYNNYKSGHYIAQISGVSVVETVNDVFYYTIVTVLSFALGVMVVVFVELKNKKKI